MSAAPAPAPADDPSIPDETELWRRIPSWHWVKDHDTGGRRISSAAFEDDEDGDPVSVVIVAECTGGLATLLAGLDGFGVAVLTVGQIRARGLGVVRRFDDTLPGHAHLTGKKTPSIRKKLAKEDSRIVLEPAVPLGA